MRWYFGRNVASSRRRSDGERGLLSARSAPRRFAFIIVVFAALQAAIIALSLLAISSIDTTRAYVAGEDAYTKGEKEAALDLRRYLLWGEVHQLEAFHQALAVPIGDRIAREELESGHPDLARVYAGFRQGRNDPQDVAGLARLFRWFSWWGPFADAVEDWREGDGLIAELGALGEEVATAYLEGKLSAAARSSFLARIDTLDERLTLLENDFSRHMGDAARATRDMLILGLVLSTALLWGIGMRLSWRTFRSGIAAERRLARSEQRFRDFANVASDWFWETDGEHRFTYLSGRAASDGTDIGAFIGKTLIEIARGNRADEAWRRHLEDLATHRPFRDFAYSYVRPDGVEQFWSVSGAPVRDHTGAFAGYRGTGSEVTREVLAQRSLEHAKDQAETANRAKSEFLANMSHELRTPLNAILGFAEIIRDRLLGPIGDRYAEYAKDIHASGTHLLGIINDILDLSKVEAGRLELVDEVVDLEGTVKAVVLLLRERVATAGLALKVELPGSPLLVRADERKAKQVLMNLLSNAVKFTPAGGEIAVRLGLASEGGAVIEVQDTGIGIAPEDMSRALSPFGQVDSRLSRRYEGTGLGLPLARALAELHGGRIELDSAPSRGTIARFILPPERLIERDLRRWVAR